LLKHGFQRQLLFGGCWAWHLVPDQGANAIGVIGFFGQYDGARAEVVEQSVGDLAVMRLSGGHAEPDRESLRVDDRDFGSEPASGATETTIWILLFAVAAC
jgi:hypothetical protein